MENISKELSGVLPVYKPKGWTSFDVIAKLRGILRTKKLGHSGTLDPMATGVLVVFVGKATKACDMVNGDGKRYLAGFKLGLETDTQDITGAVTRQSDKAVTKVELIAVAKEFVGDIMQTPPMYSAVKVGGKKLYDLAREGKVIEREAKKRHIDFIDISEYDENTREGKMSVSVSSGTYIRTLINDIGERLGSFGTMTSLERTFAGGFDVSECFSLEELASMQEDNTIESAIKPLCRVFDKLCKISLSEKNTTLYKNGVKLRPEQVGIKNSEDYEGKVLSVYSAEGEFISVAKIDAEKNELRSVKNFY